MKTAFTKFKETWADKTFNEILGCAKGNIYGLSLIKDVDDYNNNEIACEVRYFPNGDYNRENSIIIECKLVNGVMVFSDTSNKITRFGRVWEPLLIFDDTETIPNTTEYKWYELLKIEEGTFHANNYDGEMVFVSKDGSYLLKCYL